MRREGFLMGGLANREYVAHIKKKYDLAPQNEQEKILNGIASMIEYSRDGRRSVNSILEHVARMIFRLFGIREIGIGLKDRKDGLYRYEVVLGFRQEVKDNLMEIEYDSADILDNDKYPNIKIGKRAEFNPFDSMSEEEMRPYVNRPSLMNRKRTSHDLFLEGDYVFIWMHDADDKMIGWIELSCHKDGELPSRTDVRWLEAITEIVSLIVQQRWAREKGHS
jgi:hypothetical protein